MDTDPPSARTRRIAELNDQTRRALRYGEVVATRGVDALEAAQQALLLLELVNFDRFDQDNDPHGEHDFGVIDLGDVRAFWKIDYYTPDLMAGCATPWDEAGCRRILTLMLAEEY